MERYLDGDDASRRGARAHARPRASPTATVFPVRVRLGHDRRRHRPARRLHLRDRPVARRPPAGRRSTPATPTVEVAPDPTASRWRSCSRRSPTPTSASVIAVQGAVGHGEARRPLVNSRDRRRRAAARPLHAARQGAGAGRRGRRRRHRRGRQAGRHHAPATRSRRRARRSRSPPIEPPEPVLAVAIDAAHPGRRGQARQRAAPPPGRGPGAASSSATTRPTRRCCAGIGETHLADRARAARAQVRRRGRHRGRAGRRTARRSPAQAEAEGKYKKQTGGHGQFGVAFAAGRAARARRAASSSSTRSSAARSPASSSPRSRRASTRRWRTAACSASRSSTCGSTCFDGKYHSVDSSEMSFKMAGSLGLQGGDGQGRPGRCSSRSRCSWSPCPTAYQGDVMGDLNARRGRVQGTEPVGDGELEITALVPTSEILRYAIDLRSMTGGRGRFTVDARPLRRRCPPTSSTRPRRRCAAAHA